ncbi:hypothetical protein STEG23_032181 [Scotinomys teguina]
MVKNSTDALHWCSYSLKLYECDQEDLDLVKLKRNMTSCFLHLKQLDQDPPIVASRPMVRLKAKQASRGEIESVVHEEVHYTTEEFTELPNLFRKSGEYVLEWILRVWDNDLRIGDAAAQLDELNGYLNAVDLIGPRNSKGQVAALNLQRQVFISEFMHITFEFLEHVFNYYCEIIIFYIN